MWLWVALLALGAERATTQYGEPEGLHLPETTAIEQDVAGFLWVGTQAGVARFDGERFTRVGGDLFSGWTWDFAPLPDGRVLVAGEGGPYLADGDRLVPLSSPGEKPLYSLCTSPEGVRYAADGQKLWTGGPEVWDPIPIPEGEVPRLVRCEQGPLFLLGKKTWERRAGDWTVVAETDHASIDVLVHEGARWVLPWMGPLHIVTEDGEERRDLVDGAHSDMVLRHDTVWISSVAALESFRGDHTERIDADDGFRSGGQMLVDRERSLWMVGGYGLTLFHEPDVVHFDDDDGLAHAGVRRISWDGERIWASSWEGFSVVRPDGIEPLEPVVRDTVCVSEGEVWGLGQELRRDELTYNNSLLVHAVDGEIEVVQGLRGMIGSACSLDARGRPLFLDRGQIYRVDGTSLVPDGRAPGPGGELHDTRSGPWWLTYDRACRYDPADWECIDVPGAGHFTDALERDGGRVWLASANKGVIEVAGGDWRSIGVPAGGVANHARRLSPSADEGVWLAGKGVTARVDYQEEAWSVYESLDFWQGLRSRSNSEVLELPDGDLWIATYRGLAHVPARARARTPTVPRLALSSFEPEPPADPDEPLVLGWRDSQLRARLAALSYRDRSDLRYRFRIRPDAPWIEQSSPSVQLVGLAAGAYRFEAQASLDGERWSDPVHVEFRVPPAPWFRWWAWLGYGLVAGGLGFAVHRARLARELALERERQRIALDLHDELGGGLGALGLGVGLLGDEGLTAEQRSQIAERLVQDAEQMGGTLSDIVWSLRRGSVAPQVLLEMLVDRGRQLLVGTGTELVDEGPERWPTQPFGAAATHTALMVGLEALNNAAKHARATRITLRLEPVGVRWRLQIEDDGIGMSRGKTRPGGGNGLHSMERRAARLGAILQVHELEAGTRVSLLFDPDAELS